MPRDPLAEQANRSRPFSQPTPLNRALSELISLKGYNRPRGRHDLDEIWKQVAGPTISEHTRVRNLRNGVLHIGVANSAMLSELVAFHKPSLLSAMQREYQQGRIDDLKFRLAGTVSEQHPPGEQR